MVSYINLYTEEEGNQFFTYYTPDNYTSWYCAQDAETVITLLTKNQNIRFSVYTVDNLDTVYKSVEDNDAHKTKWIPSSYVAAEKKALKTLTIGKEYYLVIYNAKPSGTDVFDTKTMNLTVGKPNMLSNSTTVYSTSSITGRKTSYSASATINATSIPRTAVIDKIALEYGYTGEFREDYVYYDADIYYKTKSIEGDLAGIVKEMFQTYNLDLNVEDEIRNVKAHSGKLNAGELFSKTDGLDSGILAFLNNFNVYTRRYSCFTYHL